MKRTKFAFLEALSEDKVAKTNEKQLISYENTTICATNLLLRHESSWRPRTLPRQGSTITLFFYLPFSIINLEHSVARSTQNASYFSNSSFSQSCRAQVQLNCAKRVIVCILKDVSATMGIPVIPRISNGETARLVLFWSKAKSAFLPIATRYCNFFLHCNIID